eukprot:7437-Heterococcus_DN1.PRE.1
MPTLQDTDYEDDFENASVPTWVSLDYADVTVEDKISGGGVGLVHRGKIGKQRVALKTLVRFIFCNASARTSSRQSIICLASAVHKSQFANSLTEQQFHSASRQFDARIDEKLKQEFMDEVMVMSRLSHPNIVRFLGANMQPPHLFFAMELCETSLYNELHVRRRTYEVREQLAIAEGVARAMHYLHER